MAKYTAENVIKVATKYIGYLEKKSNKLLDDFTANAGKGNYTRFAREFKKFAGVDYQGQAWCDMFIDTIFVEAFGINKAKELLNGFSAYTPSSASNFQKLKQWYTTNPKVGDIIFFENSSRICHTGIVTKVTDTKVYTIEGNTSSGDEIIPNGGSVCAKSYLLNNTRISGYGRPDYDIDVVEEKQDIKAEVIKYHYEYYVVKSGDSLSEIADKLNTTVDNLTKLNSIKNANSINIGQKLLITTYRLHTIVKGDALVKISQKYLGSANRYKEIMELNKMTNSKLKLGVVLKIPNK
jgi:LysM repeat protein